MNHYRLRNIFCTLSATLYSNVVVKGKTVWHIAKIHGFIWVLGTFGTA